ncbi:Uncharacterised protein [Bordetella pertussis]|nr:Uncharacterised protein [Bordetella pertussis]
MTWVGDSRGSIGPPIITMLRGWQGSLAEAISDIAASTGTVGWQTEMTWVSGPRWRRNAWM